MGYLHDLSNPVVKETTENAIKMIVDSGRVCGTSPLSMEEAQHHFSLGVRTLGLHGLRLGCMYMVLDLCTRHAPLVGGGISDVLPLYMHAPLVGGGISDMCCLRL